eukprot:447611_1
MKLDDPGFFDSVWPYILGGICILMFPIASYHCYKYYLNRNHVVYKYRYSNIVIYESIFFLFQLIWTSFESIVLWSVIVYPHDNINNYFFDPNIVFNIALCIQQTLRYSLCYLWIYRFWMLFYDIKLIVEISNNQWRKIILANDKTGWFLSHKNSLGNTNVIGLL